MGFFSTNILKAIEWADPSKDTIVYKYPMDGRKIVFGSKLTVRESQVAIFLNKGKLADVFTPGTYTLHSSNLPILSQLLALPYGFKSPFFADVFFINTKQFTNQKWGTSNPITMRDKEFGTIRLRGYGTYSFKVDNAETFLKELFGTNSTFSTEDINQYLKSMLVSNISDTIAESKISALDIASNLNEFSKVVTEGVSEEFTKLGLKLTKLIIENISFPEAVEKAIDTRSSMGVLEGQMDTYVRYQSANAIGEAAKNPGTGGVGATIGTGMALGEVIRDSIKNSTKPAAEEEKPAKFCPECGHKNRVNAKFCSECGKPLAQKGKCPKCGAEVGKAKFCPECGTKQ
ncbi:MAG: SPFH domain-containing protein [Clostridia bacterium]|nr:SPFH domain-containing protein [Clostridia bacterium]